MQPDEIDWKIIEILREEAIPNNAIAKSLGVSEGMIRQRIKKLKEAGILKVKASIDPDVLSSQQLAIVAVNISESRLLKEKAQEIVNLESVLSVSISSGRYDLMLEVLVDSNHGLVRFLTEVLSLVEGISSTESFLMLQSFNKYV